jgi:chloride channel 3/4/5
LTELNSYPFLNNKHKPIFTTDLADLVPRVRRERVIDITSSPLVSAMSLRGKLERLHAAGEIDGGLPILRKGVLVGLIPAPDLEFALDQLLDESSDLCLMAQVPSIDDSDDGGPDPTDFTRYIDPVGLTDEDCRNQKLTASIGACGSGHTFSHGPCVRVLRETGSEIYLRSP